MYEDLSSRKTINAIRRRFGFDFSKSLGQNFLTDMEVVDSIIEGADINEDDIVIEIGPGIGVMTREIAKQAGEVIAVEIDHRLIPIMHETLGHYSNVRIVQGDILQIDIAGLLEPGVKAKVIGNLPYYITTPIVMGLLEKSLPITSITVMMQKEVADRFMAEPGSKQRAAISVICQYFAEIERVVDVPKEKFVPQPKVDSTVLTLHLRSQPPVQILNRDNFVKLVKSSFAHKRKTIANSMSASLDIDKQEVKKFLEGAGIDPKRRAESLSIVEFGSIEKLYSQSHIGRNGQ